MRVLLVDNRDSFTRNLAHWLEATLGDPVTVTSYDDVSDDQLLGDHLLVLSPGPGRPADYPRYEVLRHRHFGTLGVCLGMQILNELQGGGTVPLDGCFHGRAEEITCWGRRFPAARYHSLICHPISRAFSLCGLSHSGLPMALQHRFRPWVGWQFHPESFLTRNHEGLLNDALETMACNGWKCA